MGTAAEIWCHCTCIRCGPVDAHDCDTRDCIPSIDPEAWDFLDKNSG